MIISGICIVLNAEEEREVIERIEAERNKVWRDDAWRPLKNS